LDGGCDWHGMGDIWRKNSHIPKHVHEWAKENNYWDHWAEEKEDD